MIQAKIVADSLNEFGNRITTMVVTFPRFILAELNTHRMFSRNSASSRAIPLVRMLESVHKNPFIPIAWQTEHSGMQGTEYLTAPIDIAMAHDLWLEARNNAIKSIRALDHGVKVTKQLCNRLLEPFMWHTVIITATEWENFFALRCPQYEFKSTICRSRKDCYKVEHAHDDEIPPLENLNDHWVEWLKINRGQAEIHMMALAEAMWDARNESVPVQLKAGEWHIPFGEDIDMAKLAVIANTKYDSHASEFRHAFHKEARDLAIKVAVARCARVSYTVVGEEGKEPNYENDIKLHDRLAKSGHWSPFEHCAKAMTESEMWYNTKQEGKGTADLDANKG